MEKFPTIAQVRARMKHAKEIKCLRTGIIIDISAVKDYDKDKANQRYSTPGGKIVVYQNGQYAEIITKKDCKCKSCNCGKPKS